MQKSQIKGNPFFTLTQNLLADAAYLDYLRSMYGGKIYIPTPEDSQRCFNDYYADVQNRMQNHQLKPGEDVEIGTNGQMRMSDQTSIMEINGFIAKVIFDQESNREFYVEESYPIEWMYPYLEPHDSIFKLNHQPLARLSDDIIQRDHNYWTKMVFPIIGDWLTDDTSVRDIANFAKRVFLRHDFTGFNGDSNFVENAYACSTFCKERCSIADLYAWRADNSSNAADKERMLKEADFAYRQAWALCPFSLDAVFGYAPFLKQENRLSEALLVAETAKDFNTDPGVKGPLEDLINQLKTPAPASPKAQLRAMEDNVKKNPSDYQSMFSLAALYLIDQQTNNAVELLRKVVSRNDAGMGPMRSAAQFFADVGDYPDLQTTLQKMTVADPNIPETWYDLARLDALLAENDDAIKCLQTALNLSDQRLQTNSMSLNLRKLAMTHYGDFGAVTNSPAFHKVLVP